jgi:hypothetical protein
MKKLFLISTICLALFVANSKAETGIGIVFGHPGNVGLSLRFDNFPVMGIAWHSGDDSWIGASIDYWLMKNKLSGDKLSWYFGLGAEINLYTGDNKSDDFGLGARIPIGLQFMATKNIEIFGEVAPTFYLVPGTDFDWHFGIGGRFIL